MNKRDIEQYLETYKNGLLENIIPFWIKNGIDWKDGGFTFCLDRDGTVIDTDKGVWQTGRFTWMILTMYNEVEKREEWIKIGKHGIDFLEKHCYDEKGKMYFIVDKKGIPFGCAVMFFPSPLRQLPMPRIIKQPELKFTKRKQKKHSLRFLKYNITPGLIPSKFTEKREMRGMGGPMIGIVTAQELRKNLEDESFTEEITSWIDEIQKYFLNHDYRAVMEIVGPQGEFIDHFDGRTLNPGHAIEGAWFILREARLRNNDPDLDQTWNHHARLDVGNWMGQRIWWNAIISKM